MKYSLPSIVFSTSNRLIVSACAAIFLGMAVSPSLQAQIVITPTAGTATGSPFSSTNNGFDDQPIIADLVDGEYVSPAVSSLGSNLGDYADLRQGYMDFGTGFASIQITELWTAYRRYSDYDGATPFVDLWWSDTTNGTRGLAGTFTDINSSNFNFGTQSAASPDSVLWTRDFDFSSAPVTVARRYLIVETGLDGFADGRASEFAIVGMTAVPESNTVAFLGMGLLVLLVARRRRARQS